LLHTRGKEAEEAKYSGGTIFIDEASGMVFCHLQVSLNATETLTGKHLIEREAQNGGVDVHSYQGDNGVFRLLEFQKDLEIRGQTIKFSGVGAHHQNGMAERAIRTITECACTMILHAIIHWPGQVPIELWPFAVEYATYVWNRVPKKDTGLAPIEIFYCGKQDHMVLANLWPWGCPVYVLEPKIYEGKKLPKWDPKAKRGQFLGMSKRHASTIGLICNLRTEAVSPQYHVVYDEHFTTVPTMVDLDELEVPPNWLELLTYSRDFVLQDENPALIPDLDCEWLNPEEIWERDAWEHGRLVHLNRLPAQPPEGVPGVQDDYGDDSDDDDVPALINEDLDDDNDEAVALPANDGTNINEVPPPPPERPPRPPRTCHANPRYFGDQFVNLTEQRKHRQDFAVHFDLMSSGNLLLYDLDSFLENPRDRQTAFYVAAHQYKLDEDGMLDGIQPLAFAAKANSEDTPNFYQAMNSDDAEGYYQAMEQEFQLLNDEFQAWDIVPRSKVESQGKNILGTTWAFKKKRYPDGHV